MPPLRVLVLGAGFFGRKWAQTIQASPDCALAGVVSRSPDRVAEIRRDLGLPGLPAHATLEEALTAGTADAVVVAWPQMLHRDAIVGALGAGLHVLTEKPLATSMTEARAIVEAHRARPDRVVMVSQNFRWRPHVRALGRAVRDGRAGRPCHVRLECRQAIRRPTVDAWREAMAEPYLVDFAIHHFDLLRYVTGADPVEVTGLSFRPSWSWLRGNTAAAAIMTMTGGLVVDYGGTMVAQGLETPQEGLIVVEGDAGILRLDGGSAVTLHGQGEPRTLPAEPVPEGELGHGLAEFVRAVRDGRRPETDLADNVKSFAIVAAVLESARTGRVVRVADLLAGL